MRSLAYLTAARTSMSAARAGFFFGMDGFSHWLSGQL